MSRILTQGNYRVYIQKAPGETVFLIDAQLGDIVEPAVSVDPVYHNSNEKLGDYRLVKTTQGPKPLVTTDIMIKASTKKTDLEDELRNCPTTAIYAVGKVCGSPEIFTIPAEGQVVLINNANFTSLTQSQPTAFDADGEVNLSSDVIAETLAVPRIYKMALASEATAEVTNGTSIAAANKACASACSTKVDPLEIYYVATAAGAAVTANLLFRDKNNTTPIATTADPFVADEDISSVAVTPSPLGEGKIRVTVARGTTDAGNPAEAAYADVNLFSPDVVSWTVVDAGTVNAEFAANAHSLYAGTDGTYIIGTDQGKLHVSEDYGTSYSTVNSPTANQINTVKSVENEIGPRDTDVYVFGASSNTMYTTTDKWRTSVAVTGPAAQAATDVQDMHMFSTKSLWAGFSDGTLYRTQNGGGTWDQFTLPKPVGFATVDRVNAVKFINDRVGFVSGMATDGSAAEFGVIWQTIDGGANWTIYQEATTYSEATPTGINDFTVAGFNQVGFTGDSIDSLTEIGILKA